MDVRDLTRYGVSPSLVDIWKNDGIDRLLPVQKLAVERYDLFAGRNLIVSAPTSSGKTFVGEMAAAHAITQGRRCLYLAPLKALAEEKYRLFRERYSPLGAKVVVSSRDYRNYDSAIESQGYDIAVIVYEKLQQLLTAAPQMMREVGLVVADELQLLDDRERGPEVEILLTRLNASGGNHQLVALSAVLRDSGLLADWLEARFLEHYERPVELRRGILLDGRFHYETFNSRREGTEEFGPCGDLPRYDIIMESATQLARSGEQSLIFLADKNATRGLAHRIAREWNGPQAESAVESLQSLEDTRCRRLLVECLQSGVAFHNSDLSRHERRLVERYYREGAIRIVCCTPTLAMGVNLPARNVFIEPRLWDEDPQTRRMGRRYHTRAEYDNISGRAGRLALEDDFGRSILVATSTLEYDVLRERYFNQQIEALDPKLAGADLDTLVNTLVASRAVDSEPEILEFLSSTLTGFSRRKALQEKSQQFQGKVAAAVERCIDHHLIAEVKGRLQATSLGRLCAVKGLGADTTAELARWLSDGKGRSLDEAEALYALARMDEARDQHMNMSTREYHEWGYSERLSSLLSREAVDFFSPVLDSRIHQTYEEVKVMKMALVLERWVAGEAVIEIEETFHSLSGTIRAAAETCAWLADAAASVAELLELHAGQVRFLRDMATRLESGVSQGAYPSADSISGG